MLVEIDISLFTKTSSLGRIYGSLELPNLPHIGESVVLPAAAVLGSGFNTMLTVEHVIHSPNSGPMLSLSDIVADSESCAKLICDALNQKYGLHFDSHEG